jgi:hypothetical protein
MFFSALRPELAAAKQSGSGIIGPRTPLFSREVDRLIDGAGLRDAVQIDEDAHTLRYSLSARSATAWVPEDDALGLAARLRERGIAEENILAREILLCMLHSPAPFVFDCPEGPASAIRVRCNIVESAMRTALSFDTEAAERPWDFWRHDEERGFTLIPGQALIEALVKATQPDGDGRRYAFSCYRASEYIILLALARELATVNPDRLAMLQRQWETRAIMSREFHDTFLDEHGHNDTPLPARFYTPGDRVWFRNPDEPSSDVAGYEGSWVFYLGGGLFSNFWHPERPYTLEDKCLEIFHWRHGLRHDEDGEPFIDETEVERCVRESNKHPEVRAGILSRMLRLRDLSGTYADGGCIDRTREHPRCVCPMLQQQTP